jgi:hypothetical protein
VFRGRSGNAALTPLDFLCDENRSEQDPTRRDELTARSLYEILETDYGCTIAEARETLEPVILTPRECDLLGVPAHTTALLTRRVTIDDAGVVVLLGHVLLRGDRSRYLYRRVVETTSSNDEPDADNGTVRRLVRPASDDDWIRRPA